MSYTTLSQQTGVSRTGISHHFPKKTDFTEALDGRIFKLFIEHLNLDGSLTDFQTAGATRWSVRSFWQYYVCYFTTLLRQKMLIALQKVVSSAFTKTAESQFGETSAKEVEWLIGKSLIRMSQ